jgi:hypothetical protein
MKSFFWESILYPNVPVVQLTTSEIVISEVVGTLVILGVVIIVFLLLWHWADRRH